MAPGGDSLDGILNQITTSNNPNALNHTLRNALPKESRDTILASSLSGGQDPLSVLDMRENTLGVLYILAARLSTQSTCGPPPWPLIEEFCHTFRPEHARLAPDRITVLAKGLVALAEHLQSPKLAIQPLYDLVRRYPPHPSYLTTLHSVFVQACVTNRHFTAALPVLEQPIANIDTDLSDLTYNDNLVYHYTGGVAFAALKRWAEAEEFFEICVSSPGAVAAALQLEALKKLKLVQLIATGKTSSLPKYTHPSLPRLLKGTPYSALINAYPHDARVLGEVYERERQLFATEKTLGLVQQAIDRAPRWALKKLTGTYVTLGLADIARAVRINDEAEVRQLILSMIESNDISAQISADGTVTFSDPPPQFTKAQVDRVLLDVQAQTAALGELEREVGRSKEFLGKAVKTREDTAWVPQSDEDVFTNQAPAWTEDSAFS
ncbi:COP9 signalosome complex subunit 3 [Hypsizygus marmoreus]|uniref:COP9 signalosome complex subunit 3 n=1 Tax=Hypsizygus marmoreus TaxID=39966 RepID=A0A369JFC9_HYPMA|nr:COP9 signalosome complex subunit 3 [Hypsizygus marmoreus]